MKKYAPKFLKPTAFNPKGSMFEGIVWKITNSKGTDTYDVECTDKGFTCDCSGFTFRGKCKHSSEVLQRVEDAIEDRSPKYRWS